MGTEKTAGGCRKPDPRAGLLLLVFANIIAFGGNNVYLEITWIGVLACLLFACGQRRSGIKWLLVYAGIWCLQRYILPVSPKIIATSFSIFAAYARRMLPCLMVGSLLIHTVSLRELTVALRSLHVPQKLIIPICVTLRYFPAIREEAGHIRDAMRLRSISGVDKIEALLVPLMVSATATAEELSAAAVTRGIEDPAKKTSMIRLHFTAWDWALTALGALFTAAMFLLQGVGR
ncbi:cobalt transport protein [Marvinbryantia formatexigens DSM 14469]|uniref:Cobalt transport protein n=1 Tax=Marvinbryantia formatexigens DSM 14469 TaxID=478749 RepID=C6LLX1_9FIRM|nr:energy-coupling factor transporter transmembrane component T [Marvinbryantia formatexigens]EET58381.1 cobalt transport protein [Marvinbryantia formatexigens DSM 14469]UWO24325.1 energy-coupling factor transporter transmembrane protein EcfT [Marvinbryantia formatexigens DSM 14469]SDF53984.1 energy-coupling factor transport system permease protein [Marvinbryantia formatexigens]